VTVSRFFIDGMPKVEAQRAATPELQSKQDEMSKMMNGVDQAPRQICDACIIFLLELHLVAYKFVLSTKNPLFFAASPRLETG